VYQVGINKRNYTTMHGLPNLKICRRTFRGPV